MSVLIRFTPVGTTVEQYDETIRKLEESGNWPADGCEYHVCFQGPDGIRVSEIWDSTEKFQEHSEHLVPILNEVGIVMANDPEFLEVYKTTKR